MLLRIEVLVSDAGNGEAAHCSFRSCLEPCDVAVITSVCG